MGYTRYWNRTEKPITEEFCEKVNEIIKNSEKKGIKIRNGLGANKPIVTMDKILINGDGNHELDHETLAITNTESGFDFCKTARKPYDYTVRNILEAAEQMGLVTDVSNDGKNDRIISDKDYLDGCS